jgi:hypothetical protein
MSISPSNLISPAKRPKTGAAPGDETRGLMSISPSNLISPAKRPKTGAARFGVAAAQAPEAHRLGGPSRRASRHD